MMALGPKGEALIKGFEKLELTAYLDGGGVPTIGWGHTRGVALGDTCTEAQAEEYFQSDVAPVVAALNRCLTAFVTQNQFDAMCSLAFNIGVGAFEGSTLLRYVNAHKPAAVVGGEFLRWNKDNGKIVLGLVRRRKAESDLYQSGA